MGGNKYVLAGELFPNFVRLLHCMFTSYVELLMPSFLILLLCFNQVNTV